MKKEYANEVRTFTREYMEMRSRENQTAEQTLNEYYQNLDKYLKEHKTSNVIQDEDQKSEYEDYLRRWHKTREIQSKARF